MAETTNQYVLGLSNQIEQNQTDPILGLWKVMLFVYVCKLSVLTGF